MTVLLFVPGEPRGKGRPRFAKGRTYTDEATVSAEGRVLAAWYAAGRPTIPGRPPLRFSVVAVLGRPTGHRKTDGTLSAAGLRAPAPVKRPDIDNLLKLSLDALNGCAFEDDCQVVDARIAKRWAAPGEVEYTRIEIQRLDVCDFCGRAEGHSKRCAVTKFDVNPKPPYQSEAA